MTEQKCFVFRFADVEVREREFRVMRAGAVLPVEPKAFRVLLYLLRNPNKLIPKDELLDAIWGNTAVTENSLTRAVALLRRVLEDDIHQPHFIATVATVGYRFVCPVEVVEESSGESEPKTQPIGNDGGEAPTTPVSPIVVPVAPAKIKVRARRGLWLTLGSASVAVGLAVGFALTYFLTRPQPAPKVSNYVQLTRDGKQKQLVGADGSRIYLLIWVSEHQGLAEMSTDGGELKQLPTMPAPNMEVLSLSADGTKFLVLDGLGFPPRGPFYSLPVLGGSARRLGDIVGQYARWSPDGKMLAYSSGGDLFTAKEDGSEPRNLISLKDQFGLFGLVWSPDGTHLRFDNRWSNPNPSTWEVSADGTGLHLMFPGWHNPASECCGTWTAGGKYFLFLSQNQIWALPRKGSFLHRDPKPIQLTSSPMSLSSLLPSKDGKKLFVVGETIHGELMRYNVKSGQFAPFLGGISAECPAFSQDGQWVAYVSYPEGILFRSKADGSERLQLTYPPNYAYKPRWSPDGKSLVFSAWVKNNPSKVAEISRDGGPPSTLIPEDWTGEPSWSPDGNQVLFGGKAHDVTSQIRIVDRITRQVSIVPGSQGLFSPVWSPNGRYIGAFTGDSRALMLFDFETKKWSELAQGSIGWPNFSKDGKYIYVIDFKGTTALLKTRISDHSTERIAIPKNFPGTGQFGPALALASDDSPLLLRDAGSYDVYSLDWADQ